MGAMSSFTIHHVRPVRPLSFPASDPEWEMGESTRHGRLGEILYLVLRAAAGPEATVGKDQFLYFDASDPRRKCAPDGFVKLRTPHGHFDSWKTWQRGTPELAVEILSPSDTEEKLTLEEKLARFHIMGVEEVVTFDLDADVGRRLRAWDLVDGDLVERVIEDERTPCVTLGLWFVLAPGEDLPSALRLARDPLGKDLVLTPEERNAQTLADRDRALADAHAELERLHAKLGTSR
jgi:Uma2 family endonuclease